MQKLLLSLSVAILFGCSSSQGKYLNGVYIPSHITQCVDFCSERGKVYSMTHPGETPATVECKCGDGTIEQVPYEAHRSPSMVERVPEGYEAPRTAESTAKDAWTVFKYTFWGQGSREDLPWR